MKMTGGGNKKERYSSNCNTLFGLNLKTTRSKAGMRDFCYYNGMSLYYQ